MDRLLEAPPEPMLLLRLLLAAEATPAKASRPTLAAIAGGSPWGPVQSRSRLPAAHYPAHAVQLQLQHAAERSLVGLNHYRVPVGSWGTGNGWGDVGLAGGQ
jgi:hypothetical protein